MVKYQYVIQKLRNYMYYSIIRKILFQLDPECAHSFVLQRLRCIMDSPLKIFIRQSTLTKSISCMGLSFKNPLGLAGLDKNGECIDALGALGFGHIEIGTVTPRPQSGNDKPRLFRVVEAEALINRMGFNNDGVDNLIENVKRSCFNGIIGINIGKNVDTPIEQGKDDYLMCMEKVYSYAGYIAVNISSPNTPSLRSLQYGEALEDLLVALKNKQEELRKIYHKYVPVVVKIAPDLSEEELIQIGDSLVRHNMDGVIATNTTLDHSLIQGLKYYDQIGGLSGRPLQLRSTKVIHILSNELKGRLPIIGVGGIDSLIAAREKITAGATLIQIYSGFIFRGPRLIKDILNYI
ncbi:dihydroorotate oxidase [Serratia symbiotica str. 'Cinara cedri']|nr:dihydroorotate oxidase [Serratia symbiotica str. 'Cinara cedri']